VQRAESKVLCLADLFPAVAVAHCSPCGRRAGVTESCPERLRQSSDRISFPPARLDVGPRILSPSPASLNPSGPEPFRQRHRPHHIATQNQHSCPSPAPRLLQLPRPRMAPQALQAPQTPRGSPSAPRSVRMQVFRPCPPAPVFLPRAPPASYLAVVPTRHRKVRPYRCSHLKLRYSHSHPVEALDQWFENLQNYEATLVSVCCNQLCSRSR
jgi:hypothetical protein